MKKSDKPEAAGCRHFNGIQHETCRAGVDYKTVRDDTGPGMYRWPCNRFGDNAASTTCALKALWTMEELEAQEAEYQRVVGAFIHDLANDVCPQCKQPITKRDQVGRCVYARPCGHRLYQGQLVHDDET